MSRPNREQVNLAAHNLVRRMARRARLDVVRSDFYSPLLDPRSLPPQHWERPAPMPGLALELERQLELLEGELRPLIEELDAPIGPAPEGQPFVLFLDNPWYGPMDAQILYAMVRRLAPRRVVELGSGFSTLFIERALQNSADPAEHTVIDPHPSPLLHLAPRPLDLRPQSGAEAPAAVFESLQRGDLLFVDTSHTVRPGGEVIRLVLEVLPILASGVVVHFHDIFRPYEYPRVFYERYNVHWQEQYLLQAFLAFNPTFTVLCANHALWRTHPERMKRLFRGLREGMQPGGFWFERSNG